MISFFDKSNINNHFKYTHTSTEYTNDFPISGIYKCFFFCGYLGDTPIHQIIGQYDTYTFFTHHLLSL